MYELDIENFTKIVISKVETLNDNIILSNPDVSEEFPCGVVSNPMETIKRTEDNFPIYKRFSITIEWWTNSKYEAMALFQKCNILLRSMNFALKGTPIDLYDEITKKHRYGGRYEVNYNGITNSFERVI